MNKTSLDRIVDDGPNLVELRRCGGHWYASRALTWVGNGSCGSYRGEGATPGDAILALERAVEKDRAQMRADADLVPALEASLAAVSR